MRWALIVAALALSLFGARDLVRADDVRTYTVVCTTTRSHVFVANPNRIGGFVQNVGTLHVSVGRGSTTLPASHLGAFTGVTLHVGAVLELTSGSNPYKGGLECQTQPGTGSSMLEIYEELR